MPLLFLCCCCSTQSASSDHSAATFSSSVLADELVACASSMLTRPRPPPGGPGHGQTPQISCSLRRGRWTLDRMVSLILVNTPSSCFCPLISISQGGPVELSAAV